jgi:hypothetical protein
MIVNNRHRSVIREFSPGAEKRIAPDRELGRSIRQG